MQRLPVPEWIRRKRNGRSLDAAEIRELIGAYASGDVPDYQMAAFAMAVYFRGMSAEETSALTFAMRDSGDVIARGAYDGIAIDKHSTGGVGDKVSILLAPIAAVAGLRVPMICGRGLGHTGGTVDKMESVSGFRARLSRDELVSIVRRVGAVIAGQSATLAPADRALYALRDVTATVESIPLITASILAKKLAEGLDGLVVDVKHGSGAFMGDVNEARALAQSLASVGAAAGVPVTCVLTDMNSPLGSTIGNALEVREAIDVLAGRMKGELLEITRVLALEMFEAGGISDGARRFDESIASGSALERLGALIEAQGGDRRVVDSPYEHLPRAPLIREYLAESTGFLSRVDALELGVASIALGAGRVRADEAVDHAVGFELLAAVGDDVSRGEPLLRIHARGEEDALRAERALRSALTITNERAKKPSRIGETIRYARG